MKSLLLNITPRHLVTNSYSVIVQVKMPTKRLAKITN